MTGSDKLLQTPWTTDRKLRLPAAIPATSTIFYAGQAIGRDINGNIVQMDDTAKAEFIGILQELIRVQVDPSDSVQSNGLQGDKMFSVEQPQVITAKIASATAGDESKKVYWLYNNEVSYSPGNSGNYAGTVWFVRDSTHVEILPPWMDAFRGGGYRARIVLPVGTITLTKFDLNKSFETNTGVAQTINLPPASAASSGDRMAFIYTSNLGAQVTLAAAGADVINAATTYLLGTVQWSRVTVESDGVSRWLVI